MGEGFIQPGKVKNYDSIGIVFQYFQTVEAEVGFIYSKRGSYDLKCIGEPVVENKIKELSTTYVSILERCYLKPDEIGCIIIANLVGSNLQVYPTQEEERHTEKQIILMNNGLFVPHNNFSIIYPQVEQTVSDLQIKAAYPNTKAIVALIPK